MPMRGLPAGLTTSTGRVGGVERFWRRPEIPTCFVSFAQTPGNPFHFPIRRGTVPEISVRQITTCLR
jgi:hypothetical protein